MLLLRSGISPPTNGQQEVYERKYVSIQIPVNATGDGKMQW